MTGRFCANCNGIITELSDGQLLCPCSSWEESDNGELHPVKSDVPLDRVKTRPTVLHAIPPETARLLGE